MNLGIRCAVKDQAGGSKSGKRRLHLSAAFEGAFEMGQPLTRRGDAIALRMHPSRDASPELRHSPYLPLSAHVSHYLSGSSINHTGQCKLALGAPGPRGVRVRLESPGAAL